MALNERNRQKFVSGMNRRIAELRAKTEQSLDFAIDTMFQERIDAFLRLEEGLAEVDRMLNLIEGDVEETWEFNAAQRVESRLEFIEDRFDEFDSEIRQRPRRRRNRVNLFNFFIESVVINLALFCQLRQHFIGARNVSCRIFRT